MTAGGQQDTPREADAAFVSVRDNPRASRFELRVNGVVAGYVTYRDARSGRAFEHTVMATEYQGMGLASQLIRSALDEARATGRTVLPSARSCVPSSSNTRLTSTSWASHNASVSRCTHPTRGDAPSTQGGLDFVMFPALWETSPRPAIAKDRTLLSGVPVAVLSRYASLTPCVCPVMTSWLGSHQPIKKEL
jgi:predicted GNAT family acetyltransferase